MKEWIKNLGLGGVAAALGTSIAVKADEAVKDHKEFLAQGPTTGVLETSNDHREDDPNTVHYHDISSHEELPESLNEESAQETSN